MTFTIIADENIPELQPILGGLGTVVPVNGRLLHRAQLKAADALLVRSVTRVDAALLAGTDIQFVGSATSGIDHIDDEYLIGRGITFAHAPGSNANSVVEYVLSAIAAVDQMLEGLMAGAAVGIVGYGFVGQALARRLDALGITYCVFDPWLDQGKVDCATGLDAVLQCSVVSLHAALTLQQPWPSQYLFSRKLLQRLPPQTLLINTSRGAVIDNVALLEQLEMQGGPRTVLDVWDPEPNINAALLNQVTLGTAHIAGYSLDGKIRATHMLQHALARHLGVTRRPAVGRPDANGNKALTPPTEVRGPALVRFLLHSRYCVNSDDILLRAAVAAGAGAHGDGFDLLRKHYAERHELANTAVRCSRAQRPLVQALGCVALCGEGTQ